MFSHLLCPLLTWIGKEPACQYKRFRFSPWVWKIPCRRAWQPTPRFLPGESHGQRSLAGYRPWGCKESDTTEGITLTQKAGKGRGSPLGRGPRRMREEKPSGRRRDQDGMPTYDCQGAQRWGRQARVPPLGVTRCGQSGSPFLEHRDLQLKEATSGPHNRDPLSPGDQGTGGGSWFSWVA